MISPQTILDLRNEIKKLDQAINACQDEYGNTFPWCKYRLSSLISQREDFYSCIKWMESEIGVEV